MQKIDHVVFDMLFFNNPEKKSGGLKKGDYKVDCRLAKADNINKASRSKADEQRTARRHSMKVKMKERANT